MTCNNTERVFFIRESELADPVAELAKLKVEHAELKAELANSDDLARRRLERIETQRAEIADLTNRLAAAHRTAEKLQSTLDDIRGATPTDPAGAAILAAWNSVEQQAMRDPAGAAQLLHALTAHSNSHTLGVFAEFVTNGNHAAAEQDPGQ